MGLGALAFAIFSGCAPSGPKPLSVGGPDCVRTSESPSSAACERFAVGHLLVELKPEVALAPFTQAAQTAQSLVAPELAEDPALPTLQLAGVTVQVVRQLFPPSLSSAGGALYLLRSPAQMPEQTLADLAQVQRDPRVKRAEPDRIRRPTALPNDPLLPQQWGLSLIHAPEAWATTEGSSAVTVAVLDTGIVPGHPDLQARIVPGYDFIFNPLSADDGDLRRDADPTDTGTVETSRLHGTHVAGIIGALTNNRLGIAGVDQHCGLMPVRVLGVRGGDGLDSDITDALRWSAGVQVGTLPRCQTPAQVLNLSFGGPGLSFTLQRAIREVTALGAVVVAAAGNGGTDAATYSPGGLDGVLCVGATGEPSGPAEPASAKPVRAAYSNYGSRVDVVAPGGDLPSFDDVGDMGMTGGQGILSTYRDEGTPESSLPPFSYGTLIGTSQAAPHVSGAVALVKALLPRAGASVITQLIRSSADPKYRCELTEFGGCGAGLLNVQQAVQLAATQATCACTSDEYCEAGQCVAATPFHPSAFDLPIIRGGFCAVAPGGVTGGARSGTGLAGLLLVAVWLLAVRTGRAA